MNLNNFEEYIEEIIVERGYDYFNSGHVNNIDDLGDGVFSCYVVGTEMYTATVELDENKNIKDTSCNCPYDFGCYCKHQVAAFLLWKKCLKINLN